MECCRVGGADPLVRAGRPRPAFRSKDQALAPLRQADEGVGGGPGGPPHHLCRMALRKIGCPTVLQYALAITARWATVSPVTMHLPGPSYSSTSGILRTVVLNSLRRASHMGSSLMCAMTNLPPPFSAVASRRIASTSPSELASTVLAFMRSRARVNRLVWMDRKIVV